MEWRRELVYKTDRKEVCAELNILAGRIFVARESDNDGL
jgi:hypothetical protein